MSGNESTPPAAVERVVRDDDGAHDMLPVPDEPADLAPAPGPLALAPAETLRELFAAEDARYEAIVEWLKRTLVAGCDYGLVPGCGEKPGLFKPGAEKLCQRLRLQPVFHLDTATREALGSMDGLVCYKCELVSRDTGEILGEGRGAAYIQERKRFTHNSVVKIAEKRAQVDAVLRTVGLSEVFAQDLEDGVASLPPAPAPARAAPPAPCPAPPPPAPSPPPPPAPSAHAHEPRRPWPPPPPLSPESEAGSRGPTPEQVRAAIDMQAPLPI